MLVSVNLQKWCHYLTGLHYWVDGSLHRIWAQPLSACKGKYQCVTFDRIINISLFRRRRNMGARSRMARASPQPQARRRALALRRLKLMLRNRREKVLTSPSLMLRMMRTMAVARTSRSK